MEGIWLRTVRDVFGSGTNFVIIGALLLVLNVVLWIVFGATLFKYRYHVVTALLGLIVLYWIYAAIR